MGRLTCKDLGMDCAFEVTGINKSEIMKKFIEHAEPAHAMPVLTADVIYRIQKAIKE